MRINRRLTLGALLLVVTAACNAGGGSTQAPSRGASSGAPSTGPSTAMTSQAPGESGSANLPPIKIGSVGFDEARVMAELYAQVLEANGYKVDRAGIGLRQRPVVAPAIESGQIDLQPEYIGSRISYELTSAQPSGGAPSTAPSTATGSAAPSSGAGDGGITGPTGDSATNLTNLQTLLGPKNLTVLDYTPAVDTNA